MIKNIKDLSIGDVLLYKPETLNIISHLIAFFSNGGKYSHAAVYIGNGEIIESHIDTNVHKTKIKSEDFKLIDVYRYPLFLDSSEKKSLVQWYKSKIGRNYDLAAFPSTFVKSVVANFFGFKNFRKSRPVLNNDNAWYCSELVSEGYYDMLGINIVPGLHPMSQTPDDLSKGTFKKVM